MPNHGIFGEVRDRIRSANNGEENGLEFIHKYTCLMEFPVVITLVWSRMVLPRHLSQHPSSSLASLGLALALAHPS